MTRRARQAATEKKNALGAGRTAAEGQIPEGINHMDIVSFPSDLVGADVCGPTQRAAQGSGRMPCARGLDLRRAREAAGMSHEDVARRRVVVLNLQQPSRNGGQRADVVGEYDLKHDHIALYAREVARLERTSADAYARAAADAGSSSDRRKSWRPWPHLFDGFLNEIALGPADATLEQLRAALAVTAQASAIARRAGLKEDLRRRGESVARLVWNHAEDSDFLDRALVEELRAPTDGDEAGLGRWESFLVRVVLNELAGELRLLFPDRPRMQLSDWQGAV